MSAAEGGSGGTGASDPTGGNQATSDAMTSDGGATGNASDATGNPGDETGTELDCSECGLPGCFSQLTGGQCVCEAGYEWADPTDPMNFQCVPISNGSGGDECPGRNSHLEGEVCVCDDGFEWCDPSDINNQSCCLPPR